MEPLRFFLNGKPFTKLNANPRDSLADFLRSDAIRLMGTKVADHEGLTGIDTVTVVDCDEQNNIRIRPLLAALVPLVAVQGKNVVTVEGLGNLDKMHPLQQQFACCNPTQCGFCEGGFIMSLYTLLRNKQGKVSSRDIEEAFDGNICRCTGYSPIAAVAAAFAEDATEEMLARWHVKKTTFDPKEEPELPKLFCSSLKHTYSYITTSGEVGYTTKFFAPSTLEECLKLFKEFPQSERVAGNTHGTIFKTERLFNDTIISLQAIKELNVFSVTKDLVELGAARTVAELQKVLNESASIAFNNAGEFSRYILSTQRRNQATLGGELFHSLAEPDLAVILSALDAKVKYISCSSNKMEESNIAELQKNIKDVLLIVSVSLAPSSPNNSQKIYFFREAMRKVNFPPYFSGALRNDNLFLGGLKGRLNEFNLISLLPEVAKTIFGIKKEDNPLLMSKVFSEQVMPKINIPKADRYDNFRKFSLCGHLIKATDFFASTKKAESEKHTLPHTIRHWPPAVTSKVGHNTKLLSARITATGGTTYPIDASAPGLLHSAMVLAQQPGFKIVGFEAEEALKIPGVVTFLTAKDIPGKNLHSGIPPADTKVFQDDVCLHYNEPCGLVVAETKALADFAASKVKVKYSEQKVKEVYPDIASAMKGKSYHPKNDEGAMVIIGGDVEKGMKESDQVFETECFLGGQDHTYAEPINCMVIPEEDNTYSAIISCQNMSKCQSDIADVLKIPHGKVTCKVTHIGGGFGGKQDRPSVFATQCALAASVTKRPVRLTLSRKEDMLISGGRHPFYYKYKVGFMKTGKINAVDILLVADGGATYDVTAAVLNKALFQSNGPYTFPNFRCEGRAAKTSRVTNTAYRGFGGPQGAFVVEHILQNISYLTNVPPEKVRLLNLNRQGDINISGTFNQKDYRVAEDIPLRCWEQLIKDNDILERAEKCREFNKTSKTVKRSVGFCNVRNATLFEERFMNQAAALVHVLKDGSVVVAHSGVEMGQGLHEKVRMAVTEILPVSRERVRILETSTDTCANTQPTSASSGNDLNVAAVVECCKQIYGRLKHKLDKGTSWEGACIGSYFDAEDLHASHHFSGPFDLQYDWNYYQPGPSSGPTGLYCGYGSAAVEVELDTLTGEWKTIQANVLEDAGRAMNPFTDLGQVEGGFIMGTALMTTEEVAWDENAQQETDCLAAYALPTISDVPRRLVSSLLDDAPNESSCAFKSKACEETPTLFGCSSFFALMDAVAAARADRGKKGPFRMDSPATKHNILQLIYGDE